MELKWHGKSDGAAMIYAMYLIAILISLVSLFVETTGKDMSSAIVQCLNLTRLGMMRYS